MARLREKIGAEVDDPRLIGIRLDLAEPSSDTEAAAEIEREVGAHMVSSTMPESRPRALVEETPVALWENMFATNVFGPVALTKARLPSKRTAGRGRMVLVSSQSGVRGMPATAPYSAVKAALERWGESMAGEVSCWQVLSGSPTVPADMASGRDSSAAQVKAGGQHQRASGASAASREPTPRGQQALRVMRSSAADLEKFIRCLRTR
jgi:NAD(P)-dependent dehydrogenase (short-subunit alcohol dehydrogenase family)